MGTGSFIVYIKIDDIYKNIAEDLETRFDTSNYELDRLLLSKGKNKKVFDLMKDELAGKIMKNSSDWEQKIKFEDYKLFLEATQLANKINKLEKNKFNLDSLKESQKYV